MDNTVRIDVEGQVITLSLKYDPHARQPLVNYWPVIAHAEMRPGEEDSIECGSCRYFRPVADSLLGVCHNDTVRRSAEHPAGPGTDEEEPQ